MKLNMIANWDLNCWYRNMDALYRWVIGKFNSRWKH